MVSIDCQPKKRVQPTLLRIGNPAPGNPRDHPAEPVLQTIDSVVVTRIAKARGKNEEKLDKRNKIAKNKIYNYSLYRLPNPTSEC